MSERAFVAARVFLCVIGLLAWDAMRAEAGGPVRRRARWIETVARPSEPTSYPMLGTFYPTPYTMVRGNFPTGGGYSPLGTFGDQTMVLNGPISAFRTITAPVRTYTRGYDGRLMVVEGTSFSTPNQPDLTPVVYPTKATYYYGPRQQRTPPWWDNGMTWIDQN